MKKTLDIKGTVQGTALLSVIALAGCGDQLQGVFKPKERPAPTPAVAVEPAPETPAEPALDVDGQTPDALDTTSAAEQAQAAAPPPAAEPRLGVTIMSLGDPVKTGFWMETPLVSAKQPGRVSYKDRWAKVTLIPIDGPATAGSRASLATFRLLDAPLTELIEVEVFKEE